MFQTPRLLIVAAVLGFAAPLSLAASVERNPDFADGLNGGPDYWEVAGIGAGDALSLRREPSPVAATIARFDKGTLLRNRGCRIVRARRWCRVETTGGAPLRGWVAGRYLRESGGPH